MNQWLAQVATSRNGLWNAVDKPIETIADLMLVATQQNANNSIGVSRSSFAMVAPDSGNANLYVNIIMIGK